jgi:hypothetical protein
MQCILNPRRHRFPKDERRHRCSFKKPDADTQGHITSVRHPASMTISYVETAHGYPLHMKRKKCNQGIIESSAKGKRSRPERTHAQGTQDVMKISGASSCPIREFVSPECQLDLHLQSMTQARIQNAAALCSGSRFVGTPPLQTGSWYSSR